MKKPAGFTGRRAVFLSILLFLISLPFWFPRSVIVGWLKVPGPEPGCVDLAVILGGGFLDDGSAGFSSRERLQTFLKWWETGNCPCPVLVSEYAGGRDRLEHVLVENGFPSDRFVRSGFRFNSEKGGTIQNAEEVVHVLEEDGNIQAIAVFTSPYHQRRVWMALRGRLDSRMDDGGIRVFFIQVPDDGEIMNCSRLRFLRLVAREFAGIVIQAIR